MTLQSLLLLACFTMVRAAIRNSHHSLPTVSMSSPALSSSTLMEGLRHHGAVVFTDLGEEYTAAVGRMKEKAPLCLDGALQVTMDDGSHRFTLARDTVSSTNPFPECLAKEAADITAAFDQVDQVFSRAMKQEYGPKLDVLDPSENSVTPWDDYGSKTHLHVYQRSQQQNNASLALPYHTDNGLYVLLTPSDNLPLRSISSDGSVNLLGTGDVILLLGTGLTEWLLPGEGLYAAPHALPALSTSLTPAPRTVMARMRVAPGQSRPQTGSQTSFHSHFSAPFEVEGGPTLARLRKQRSSQCALDWPHACGCVLPEVYFTWHNGEPIGQKNNVANAAECQIGCRDFPGCVGWTLNNNNGWCAFKSADQIKPQWDKRGFTSGMMDAGSTACSRRPRSGK